LLSIFCSTIISVSNFNFSEDNIFGGILNINNEEFAYTYGQSVVDQERVITATNKEGEVSVYPVSQSISVESFQALNLYNNNEWQWLSACNFFSQSGVLLEEEFKQECESSRWVDLIQDGKNKLMYFADTTLYIRDTIEKRTLASIPDVDTSFGPYHIANIDSDTRLELLVRDHSSGKVSLIDFAESFSFTRTTIGDQGDQLVSLFDFNSDGLQDIILANSNMLRIFDSGGNLIKEIDMGLYEYWAQGISNPINASESQLIFVVAEESGKYLARLKQNGLQLDAISAALPSFQTSKIYNGFSNDAGGKGIIVHTPNVLISIH